MYGVWNAPATCSGDDPGLGRRLGGQLLQPVDGAGGDDLAGAVAVGRVQPGAVDRGEHLVLVAAEHGAHAGRLERAGGGHLAAADGGEGDRGLRGEHAGERGRAELADAVAGDHRRPVGQRQLLGRGGSAAATSSGWVWAVSLISSASALVPRWTRSTPGERGPPAQPASAARGRSSHGARKPGFWEPWPGASTASTCLPSRGAGRPDESEGHEGRRASFVGIPQFRGVSRGSEAAAGVDFLLRACPNPVRPALHR